MQSAVCLHFKATQLTKKTVRPRHEGQVKQGNAQGNPPKFAQITRGCTVCLCNCSADKDTLKSPVN